MKKLIITVVILMLLLPLLAFAGGGKEQGEKGAVSAGKGSDIAPWIIEMRKGLDPYRGSIDYKGEYGAIPTWDTNLVLTVDEVNQIRAKKAKVGYVMDAAAGDHTNSLLKGMKDVFSQLGINLIGTVDPQFDVEKERAGAENFIAMGADLVIGAPIDPVASAESFRPVLNAGKKFVIWSNIPKGYVYGKDFVGVSSAMAQDLGRYSVQILKEGVSSKTEVAYLFFDAKFWVVNLIDDMVKKELEKDPNLVIVEELGFSTEKECFDLMSAAIQRHPNIKRVYACWNVPAQFAADACKQSNRLDIKIACFGVDEPTLIDILKGGNIMGTVSDDPYHLGANLALLAGFGVIGKKAPEFTITPAIPITKANLQPAWDITQKTPMPDSVKQFLK
jgi:ribose transport system substrate-binding protein